MAHKLEKYMKNQGKPIKGRMKRDINKICQMSSKISNSICDWYKIDQNDEIILNSKTDDILGNEEIKVHGNYQCHIQLLLDDLKSKVDFTTVSLNRNKRYERHVDLFDILHNIETEISKDIYRKLQSKRRKEMYGVCRLERVQNKIKVHNFSTENIERKVMDLLSKGPGYIPHQFIPLFDIDRYKKTAIINIVKQMTWAHTQQYHMDLINLELNKPSLHRSIFNGTAEILDDLDSIISESNFVFRKRESLTTLKGLSELANNQDIIVNTADKNLGLVINNTSWYVNELNRQLADKLVYVEVGNCTIENIVDISKHNLLDLQESLKRYNMEQTYRERLDIMIGEEIRLPSLNLLPKVHKLKVLPNPEIESKLKGRPIVNGFKFTTSKVSRLLYIYMEDIYEKFRVLFQTENIQFPCIRNGEELIDRVKGQGHLTLTGILDVWLVNFDFESLYTNVTDNYVHDLLHFAKDTLSIPSNDIHIATSLYTFIKRNAFFHIGYQKIYRQVNGLTMGSYDAQLTSSNVLLMHELRLLSQDIMIEKVRCYSRYIDDGFCVIFGDYIDVLNVIDTINRYLPTTIPIEFSINKFQTHFLDLWITIDHETFGSGRLGYKIYQKEFNTYSYVHRDSNHPDHVFKGLINTELIRYRRKSSNYIERKHIEQLFKIRLRRQGYRNQDFLSRDKRVKRDVAEPKKYVRLLGNRTYGINAMAKKVINKYKFRGHNVQVIYKNQRKLKEILLTKYRLHKKIGSYMDRLNVK